MGTNAHSDYVFLKFDAPSGDRTIADSLDSNGKVVGTFYKPYDPLNPSGTRQFGYVYTNGVYHPVDYPHEGIQRYSGVELTGITDSGTLLGIARIYLNSKAFTLKDGVYALPVLGYVDVEGINEAGVIVGNRYNPRSPGTFAEIIENGVVTDLRPPGSTYSSANDINSHNQVVGWYSDGSGGHSFLYQNGTFTVLNAPLAVNGTYAVGLNDQGDIVGRYYDADYFSHGFIYRGGIFTTFDYVDPRTGIAQPTTLNDINNAGQIVGNIGFSNLGEGFLASPECITPILVEDRWTVIANRLLRADAEHGVLANDEDPIPDDTLWVTAVNGSADNVDNAISGRFGSLTLNWDGSYSYKAFNQKALPTGSVGVDNFIYTASTGEGITMSSTATFVVTRSNQKYYGGLADETINGPNRPHTVLDGGAGGCIVNAGNKGAVLIGGHDDLLKGGAGADTFVFAGKFGTNTIQNFDTARDRLQFDLSFYDSLADIQSHAQQIGNDTVIDGWGTNDVTLTGVQLASLRFDNAHFLIV